MRELERREAELRDLAGARERELDLLAFELDEIEAAAPSLEEEAELSAERDRLRHAETLRRRPRPAPRPWPPRRGPACRELLAGAAQELEQAAAIDPALAAAAERLEALRYEAEDVGAELRGYLDDVAGEDAGPQRLEQVEERLAVLARLERKHGGGIAEVLAHAERCRAREAPARAGRPGAGGGRARAAGGARRARRPGR